jgi:lactate racemase
MNDVELAYGQTSFKITLDQRKLSVIATDSSSLVPLTDVEIGAAFDSPIESPPLDEVVSAGDSVLIVVSDATRATGSGQVVNLLVRRLIQSGVSPAEIAIIFATGIHRPVTHEEKLELLTPFIVQRVRTLTHDAYDPGSLISLGTTERGVPIQVNRALTEFSKTIIIGGIGFHYFAGFTGGRKSICPGLASAATIEGTHMLALDFERGGRQKGVGTGLLDGNAVHEECERVAKLVSPAFVINTIVDAKKRVVGIFCGDWLVAHRAACAEYLRNNSVDIDAKRDLVIVSCGGFPHDINLIQAHKSLEMASRACQDGGAIVMLAECRDGLGRRDFLKWFEGTDSGTLEQRLRTQYEVNGQTAWSLLIKAKRFRVHLVSELPSGDVKKMHMEPSESLETALNKLDHWKNGYVMPRGAAVLPRVASSRTTNSLTKCN